MAARPLSSGDLESAREVALWHHFFENYLMYRFNRFPVIASGHFRGDVSKERSTVKMAY
jgi:hypothetical protein